MSLSIDEFTDLCQHAMLRCRKQITLTAQLLDDDDEQIAALLTSVAIDMIRAATHALCHGSSDLKQQQEMLDTLLANVAIATRGALRRRARTEAGARSRH